MSRRPRTALRLLPIRDVRELPNQPTEIDTDSLSAPLFMFVEGHLFGGHCPATLVSQPSVPRWQRGTVLEQRPQTIRGLGVIQSTGLNVHN